LKSKKRKSAKANGKNPPANQAKKPSIADDLSLFVQHIEALAGSFPFITTLVNAARAATESELGKYLAKHGKVIRRKGTSVTYTVTAEHASKVKRLRNRRDQGRHAGTIIPRSFIVALISQYDSFLGRLVRALFLLKPEVLNAADRTLTFAQLTQFKSVADARDFIVEKEVETVLRKSHAEQFDWLENKFDIQLRAGLTAWPRFIEVTERRNLFVHSDGVVSSQYLQVCQKQGCDLHGGLTVGQTLDVDPDYFIDAYRCILEIGVKLAHVLWRKLAPEEREAADQNLNEISFELINNENFEMARRLLDFATCVLKQYSSEQYRRIYLINRAQTYKWLGRDDEALAVLEAEDWSASSDKFGLTVAVLRDEFAAAAALMRKVGRDGEMKREYYEEWPVFREFRKSEPFAQAYEAVFGVKFSVQESAANTSEPITANV
jgi:hypothetical protein